MSDEFRESPRLQAEILAHALGADARVLDFVARFADAWNGRGDVVFTEPERQALCDLAGLSRTVSRRYPWQELFPEDRRRLLVAARRAIEFARACAWVFGEGEGPRI